MPKMTRKLERRKAERIPLKLSVKYRIKGSRAQFKEALNENVGGLGLNLVVGGPLPKNALVELVLRPFDTKKQYKMLCMVRWCRQIDKNKFQVGVCFNKINEYMSFVEFLCEKIMCVSMENGEVLLNKGENNEGQ